VRGYTNDFDPSKAHMHISSDLRDGESTIILLSDLKALFFVREFAGNPMREDDKFFSQTPNGDRMEVTFLDNEVMVGSTQSYLDEGQGFFLQPADPRSNNLSVFVTLRACSAHASFRQSGNKRIVRNTDVDRIVRRVREVPNAKFEPPCPKCGVPGRNQANDTRPWRIPYRVMIPAA
jgi:hypothetical protein